MTPLQVFMLVTVIVMAVGGWRVYRRVRRRRWIQHYIESCGLSTRR